jgi:phosphoglycerate dehydrogenase-like enzyme
MRVSVQPTEDAVIVAAVERAGARVTPLADADALVWTGSDPAEFPRTLPDGVRWVQLPGAGVERWIAAGVVDRDRVWTSATGAYAATVAEHALALLLAGVRGLALAARQTTWRRAEVLAATGTLRDAVVTIVGAGGIGRALIPMLVPLGARVVAVNRSGRPVDGAARTVSVAELDTVLTGTDHVVVAAPSTPDSRHLIDASRLAALKPTSWLVNVARGELVDTDALCAALRDGVIAGAALDVTDPEPLPEGHPLWTDPRAIVTPHSANPGPLSERALADRVADNIARRTAGTALLGRVDLDAGY